MRGRERGGVSEQERLTGLWERRRPLCPPVADRLKLFYDDVWVRFHSLPESKRYPEDESEYATVLDRYNTVLDELFAGQEVYVVTTAWTDEPEAPLAPSGAFLWQSLLETDDPDPDFRIHLHLYATRRAWQRGCVDPLLRAVADERQVGVLITDTSLRRIHHPYDGGADVLLPTTAERDTLRARHAAWLSSHPLGL